MWNLSLDTFLRQECNISPSLSDRYLYVRHKEGELEISIMIYFDDIFIMS